MVFSWSIILYALYVGHQYISALSLYEPTGDPYFSKELGQLCTADDDCAPAYSYCDLNAIESQRTCKCFQGFPQRNGLCIWKGNYICPTNNGNITAEKSCIVMKDKSVSEHDCGVNEYCYVEPNTFTPSGDQVGRCCQKLENASHINTLCPVGLKKSEATCMPQDKINDPAYYDTFDETCSSDTHTCSYYDNNNYACCQNPCHIWGAGNIDGRCFRGGKLNRPCMHDAQCYVPGSRCYPIGINGQKTCRCHPETTIEERAFCSNINADALNENGPLLPPFNELMTPR